MLENFDKKNIRWAEFIISAGFLFVFVVASMVDYKMVGDIVTSLYAFVMKYLGALLQGVFLLIFITCLIIGFSRLGDIRIGGKDSKPDLSTFTWFGIILTTLLAGGGVFFSASEPLYHFLSVPPMYPGIEPSTAAAVAPAFALSYLHWGFQAWAVQAIGVSILVYACEYKGMPLRSRTLLYPFLGEKGVMGVPGTLMESFSLVAVAAGTIGPVGFLGLQLSYSLNQLVGIPDNYATQLLVLVIVTAIFTIAASTGIYKGISMLSNWTIYLTVFMIGAVLFLGPGRFILDSFLTSMGLYLSDFTMISLSRVNPQWEGSWTAFYWAWFLSYAPTMSILLINISKGRTLRQLMFAVGIFGPIMTNLWFTILGGTGIFFEMQNVGSISKPLYDSGLPAALLTIMKNMPIPGLMVPISLILVVLFLVTTGAGIAYTMATAVTGMATPYRWVRITWGVLIGAVAALLIKIGESSITALQNFIVIATVPLFILYIPQMWGAMTSAVKVHALQFGERSDSDKDDEMEG
jgi:choline-glycine betaine transporter